MAAATPNVFSISFRAEGIVFALFTNSTTTGIVASLPIRSVPVRSLSRNDTSPSRNLTAFARSIRCGKSTFHGCGGTYGHFVM